MTLDFKARAICSEFNISNICKHYNINKKIKWEEPLVLKGEHLSQYEKTENKMVYIYYFGAIVFINFQDKEIQKFIEEINNIPASIKNKNKDIKYNCIDDYQIVSGDILEDEIGSETSNIKTIEDYHIDMTSLVLAKSVALETIENRVSVVSDEVEKIIVKLKKGKIHTNGKKICSTIGTVLSFKHTIISYLMLLDKPDAIWKNENAKDFFNSLADVFELDDRYETLNSKTEFLLDTTEIFADFSHSKRAAILEIIVILLILVEVVHAFEPQFIQLVNMIISLF